MTFRVPDRLVLVFDDDFGLGGSYSRGCDSGDYIQFTVDGKKSKKLCGWGGDLGKALGGHTLEIVGRPDKPAHVEAVFVSGDSDEWAPGFKVTLSSAREWTCEQKGLDYDGDGNELPKLPME